MPPLLLDVHIAARVAVGLRGRGVDALALIEWHGGAYVDFADEDILRIAFAERRTFVTFDVSTIPPLIRALANAGVNHAGVVFISARAFRQDDVGGLVRALAGAVRETLPTDMTNQVAYLRR